jgi:hypothetical protein
MDDSWAAIAIVGITLSLGVPGIVACVWLWAWRGRKSMDREDGYKQLAEDARDAQRRTAFELGQMAEDLGDVRTRVIELERMLKEVE